MKMAWKTAVALTSLLLASCGGGGGNAAISKSFNYGAAQAPNSSEQLAADSAATSVAASSSFGSSPDSSKATTIVGLADDLAATALGGSPIASAGFVQNGDLSRAMRTAATIPECTTTTLNSVTFNNCQESESGFTFTLSGSVTVNVSAAQNSVEWNITGSFTGTDPSGVSINLTLHQSGKLTVTATTVVGDALSEIGGSVSGQGQSVSFALHTAASVNLTYSADCITAGSIEVKRVWAQRPNGFSGPEFADVAVKLTWTGCDTVQVQHSL